MCDPRQYCSILGLNFDIKKMKNLDSVSSLTQRLSSSTKYSRFPTGWGLVTPGRQQWLMRR